MVVSTLGFSRPAPSLRSLASREKGRAGGGGRKAKKKAKDKKTRVKRAVFAQRANRLLTPPGGLLSFGVAEGSKHGGKPILRARNVPPVWRRHS